MKPHKKAVCKIWTFCFIKLVIFLFSVLVYCAVNAVFSIFAYTCIINGLFSVVLFLDISKSAVALCIIVLTGIVCVLIQKSMGKVPPFSDFFLLKVIYATQ